MNSRASFSFLRFGVMLLLFGLVDIEITMAEPNAQASTTTAVPTFQSFEKMMKRKFANILMSSLSRPQNSATANVTQECTYGLFQVALGVMSLKEWAVKLLDSSGKISSGILEGSATTLGDYDECLDLNVNHKERTSRYCMVEIKLNQVLKTAIKEHQFGNKSTSGIENSKTFLRFLRHVRIDPEKIISRIGICMPAGCTVDDVQELLDDNLFKGTIPGTVKRCEERKELKIELHQIVILSLCSLFITMVIIGTLMDVCCFSDNDIDAADRHVLLKIGHSIRSTFSVYRNTGKLLSDSSEKAAPRCCSGLLFLTVVLSIYVDTYTLPHPVHLNRYRNAFNLFKFSDNLDFCQVANPTAGVEILFMLAGFASIYKRWINGERHQLKTGEYIFKHVLQSFLRMILAQTLVVCLFMLLPLLGSGPLWQEFVEETLDKCKVNWWQNLVFIQNFKSPYDTCLHNTWVLAAMMQIIIFTSGVIWITERWPFFGACMYISITVVAGIIVAIVTVVGEFPPTFSIYFYDYRTSLILWKYLYVQAYNHIGPYCIGAIVALVLATHQNVKIKTPILVLCWCTSLASILAIVYGLYDYRDGQPMNRTLAVFYSAVHRPAWAVAFGWIMYSCHQGYGGVIGRFLSWRPFIALERLSYLVYLLHIPLMYYQAGVQREMMFMGHFEQVMFFLSYTVMSYSIAYVCYLVFQAPYTDLEKILFNSDRHEKSNDGENSINKFETQEIKKESIAVLFSRSNPQLDDAEIQY